jgi:hypothetical protein
MKALLGGPLEGSALVRFIYVDEAGIAAHEPVTVVVGLIIHTDTQWLPAEKLIKEAIATVPEKIRNRDGFVFHAAQIWGDNKLRDGWSPEDRTKFICRMMSIPVTAGLGIAFAAVRRDSRLLMTVLPKFTKEKMDHLTAFGLCIGTADRHIRQHPTELAAVVAENSPKMQSPLRQFVGALTQRPFEIGKYFSERKTFGPSADGENAIQVTRVIDTIHFVEKRESTMLQIADACAFGLRRYFSGQSMGAEFAKAIAGPAYDEFSKVNPADSVNLGLFVAPHT